VNYSSAAADSRLNGDYNVLSLSHPTSPAAADSRLNGDFSGCWLLVSCSW